MEIGMWRVDPQHCVVVLCAACIHIWITWYYYAAFSGKAYSIKLLLHSIQVIPLTILWSYGSNGWPTTNLIYHLQRASRGSETISERMPQAVCSHPKSLFSNFPLSLRQSQVYRSQCWSTRLSIMMFWRMNLIYGWPPLWLTIQIGHQAGGI